MEIANIAAMSLEMLIFTVPFIFAGTSNMLFCKSAILDQLKVPIDHGLRVKGKRLFGDNKTWKGFIGMVVFSGLWLGIFSQFVDLYFGAANNWLFGAALGFGYVLLELPNSFFKRRLDIAPGKSVSGTGGLIFLIIDQADSVAGCIIAIFLFNAISPLEALVFLIVGTVVHLVVHWLLLLVRLKNYNTRTA